MSLSLVSVSYGQDTDLNLVEVHDMSEDAWLIEPIELNWQDT